MAKMKKKNYNFKVKPCPYTFYDREDIYRYGPWNQAVEGFVYSIVLNDDCEVFVGQMRIIAEISLYLHNIPSQLYEAITAKSIQLFP